MTKVHLVFAETPRHMWVDIDDAEAAMRRISEAAGDPKAVVWLTDGSGRRVGIRVAALACIEVEGREQPHPAHEGPAREDGRRRGRGNAQGSKNKALEGGGGPSPPRTA